MKDRTSRSLLRSVALVGAMAASATVFGGDYVKEWKDVSIPGDWADDANWKIFYTNTGVEPWQLVEDVTTLPEDATFDEWRILNGATVTFSSPVVGDASNVLVGNGTNTFASDGSEGEGVVNGLAKPSAALDIRAPWWFTGDTVLQITSGAFSFGAVSVNTNLELGGTATLTLNGGSLSANRINGDGTVYIGENGATIDGACSLYATLKGSGTITKTGDGDLYVSNGSGFTGKIVVEGGTASGYVATIDSEEGTYYTSAQAAFDAVADGGTVTLLSSATVTASKLGTFKVICADGVELTVTSEAPYSATYEDGVVTVTRVAAEYVYVGPTGSWRGSNNTYNETASIFDLDKAENFTVGGVASTIVPGAGDTIVFTSNTIFANRSGNVGYTVSPNIRIESGVFIGVTLRSNSGRNWVAFNGNVTGDGEFRMINNMQETVTFNGAAFSVATLNVMYDAKVHVATGVEFSSNLKGSGKLTFVDVGNKANYPRFSGNNANFEGTIYVDVTSGAHREFTRVTPSASSAKASWYFYGNNRVGDEYTPLTEEGDYYFGALNGYVYLNTTALNSYNIYVGGRNEDCSFGGEFSRGSSNSKANPYLYKVGTAKLSVSASKIRHAVIQEGTLDIASRDSVPYGSLTFQGGTLQVTATTTTAAVIDEETQEVITPATTSFVDPSAKIVNSKTASIVFDTNGGNHKWATQLAASNTKGLVKKGEGTLTLDYVPAYADFEITVEEGAVIVPEGAKTGFETVVDTTYEGDGVRLVHGTVTDTFVADDATLVDGAFTVPEGTTTITLGGVDVTKGFYIDENEPTKAKLLSPWFRWESAEEFGEGMVIDDEAGTVTLDIDLVEGLYYGPASATSLEALARPATLVKYDGTNGGAIKTIEKPDGDTAFFTIYVDVKASETTTVNVDGENMPIESEEGNGDDQG